jgi:hypothetical protein
VVVVEIEILLEDDDADVMGEEMVMATNSSMRSFLSCA